MKAMRPSMERMATVSGGSLWAGRRDESGRANQCGTGSAARRETVQTRGSLTDNVDVDVGHVEPGQVAHSEDARVGHLNFLDGELGALHAESAL